MKKYIIKRIILNILSWGSLISFVIVYFSGNTNNIIYNAVVFLLFFITMVENDILEEIRKKQKEIDIEKIRKFIKEEIEKIMRIGK